MDYPANELINIRNMGKKSIEEIHSFIQALSDGTCEFVLVETKDGSTIDLATFQDNKNGAVTLFVDETGVVVQDIPVSVRARNSLIRSGYEFTSQLVGITYDELMNLKNMGKKTAEEVLAYIEKISIKHETGAIAAETIAPGNDLIAEMRSAYGEEESICLREMLVIKAQFPEIMDETLIYRLYDSVFVRGTVKAKILKVVEKNGGEISRAALEEHLPQHLNNTTILKEILLELESSAVEMGEVMIYRQYPSVIQYVLHLKNSCEREVLQARLDGKTLQEIGVQYGITRERVRQLMQKALKKKPYLREDEYTYIYDHYDFSLDNFTLAFDEPTETYHYLEMICQTNRAKRKPLEELLIDTAIAPECRKKAERAIYKQYVSTDGVRVKTARPNLVRHYIKTNCIQKQSSRTSFLNTTFGLRL